MGRARDDIDDAEVVRLYRGGKTLKEVADALGCSTTLVRSRLRKAGEPVRRHTKGEGRRALEVRWRARRRRYLEVLEATGSAPEARRVAEVSAQRVVQWRGIDPEFAAAEARLRGKGGVSK